MKEVKEIMLPHGRTDRQTDKVNNRNAITTKIIFLFAVNGFSVQLTVFLAFIKKVSSLLCLLVIHPDIQTDPILFLVAKLLYNLKCLSICKYVRRKRFGKNVIFFAPFQDRRMKFSGIK